MRFRWGLLLLPPLALFLILLGFSQFVFLQSSLHEDLGIGRLGEAFTLSNYAELWQDRSYLDSLFLTLRLSALGVLVTLFLSWPVAYRLSRATPRTSTLILTAIVASSFVTLPLKALGLTILFAAEGPLMQALRALHLVDAEFRFLGSSFAVEVGYVHLAVTFEIMMLFSVLQAIPVKLEEAAAIHGASRFRVMWRVIIPLSLPGTVSASLVLFNLLSGAFVSAVLLGGGKILTLPVLIDRTLVLYSDYGMAATLAMLLLALIVTANIAAVFVASRFNRTGELVT